MVASVLEKGKQKSLSRGAMVRLHEVAQTLTDGHEAISSAVRLLGGPSAAHAQLLERWPARWTILLHREWIVVVNSLGSGFSDGRLCTPRPLSIGLCFSLWMLLMLQELHSMPIIGEAHKHPPDPFSFPQIFQLIILSTFLLPAVSSPQSHSFFPTTLRDQVAEYLFSIF